MTRPGDIEFPVTARAARAWRSCASVLVAALLLAVVGAGCGAADQSPQTTRSGGGDASDAARDRPAAAQVVAGEDGDADEPTLDASGPDGAHDPVVREPAADEPVIRACAGIAGAVQAWALGASCADARRLLTGFDAASGSSAALDQAGWRCTRGGQQGGVTEHRCVPARARGSEGGPAIGIQVRASG